jgi:hypothetical protein
LKPAIDAAREIDQRQGAPAPLESRSRQSPGDGRLMSSAAERGVSTASNGAASVAIWASAVAPRPAGRDHDR